MSRLSPVNMWIQSRAFLDAARREFANSSAGLSLPAYFLAARAIELGLKSYLLLRGTDERRLRRIGHDLVKASKAARENDFAQVARLTAEDEAAIAWINEYYQSKDLEYPQTGLKSFPDDQALLGTADTIIGRLEPVVRRWRPESSAD